MINVIYNKDGIKVEIGEISKYNDNLPFKLRILKHVSGELQWGCDLHDNWHATYPNVEMFDTQLLDNRGNILYTKKWDIVECGNVFYKTLWLYNKKILTSGRIPVGLVIGTHDGEFGEWVPIALSKEAEIMLIEASDKQFNKLQQNYSNNEMVKCIQDLITTDGEDVTFFEGGAGYTNSIVEKVIRSWETEEIKGTTKKSTEINKLIKDNFESKGKKIDWLHLDVEGLDAKLIMSIEDHLLPNLIIFEDNNLDDNERNTIYSWLANRNYINHSENGICSSIRK